MHISYPANLPIAEHRESIRNALAEHQVIVIAGDTGSGKTTQLPKICLEAGLGKRGMIGCTQPRRIAAISVAERVAEELRAPEIVGYKIRFQDRTRESTLIKFMTDGVLLAETRGDRLLRQYEALIIDEAHERSLNIDFLLGYVKQLLKKRPQLKLIISSATIDTEKFSHHFNTAPIISVSGRLYPITTIYAPQATEEASESTGYVEQAVKVVQDLATDPFGGDILVFMPTERDIFDTINGLGDYVHENNLILPLFGRLQAADQRRIFKPAPQRKIIIATNVAETSITVPGIRFVVDTGLARISRYNPRTGTTSLRISKVSQASCNQRQGRCGRTGPGTCIRLYAEEDFLSRDAFTLPEIQRSNLAEVILQMVSLQLGPPDQYPFVDPPHPRTIRLGFQALIELGALDRNHRLTKEGRLMASLPLDPCISRIIIEGGKQNALREITVIAAALTIQDPRVRPLDKEQQADQAHREFMDNRSDFLTLYALWSALFQDKTRVSWSTLSKFCKQHYLSWQRMREWIDVHDQLTRLLKNRTDFGLNDEPAGYEAVHMALTSGFLRNVCRKKEKNIYQAAANKELQIFPGSALYKHGGEFIVAAAFVETSQLFARTAATIKAEWLEQLGGELCKRSWTTPRWEKKSGRVIADEHVSLFGLPIISGRKINYGRINKHTRQEARTIFIREALVQNRLGRGYPFLQANLDLLAHYREVEDRLRRRTIVADDEHLFLFYDRNLGNVYDRFTLHRYLRKKKSDTHLRMTPEDVCTSAPDDNELYLYPPTLTAGEHTLQLNYTFTPGDERDGVTVSLPLQLVDSLQPTLFEWLVPGLLPEKILHLLKRLPKRLRKPLVPLPDAVDRIMDALDLYKGSLYQSIEQVLRRTYQVSVHRTDWQADTLPPFLRMRFALLDEQGTPCFHSRSLQQVHQYLSRSPTVAQASSTRKLPTIDPFTPNDFDRVQSSLQVKDSQRGIVQIYCPCLSMKEGAFSLTYTLERSTRIDSNRIALAALFASQFPGEEKQLRRECKAAVTMHSASWLSLGGKKTAGQLKEELFNYLIQTLFPIDGEHFPSTDAFFDQVNQVKEKGLLKLGLPLLQHFLEMLKKRRQARQCIEQWAQRVRKSRSFNQQRYEEYLEALEQIMPSKILHQHQHPLFPHTGRYLQALIVRVERAEHFPDKDRNKAARLQKPLNRLEQFTTFASPSPACRQRLTTYRELVEEFRVSVFAPELGTAVPVSEKRLLAYWKEVENVCRTVE